MSGLTAEQIERVHACHATTINPLGRDCPMCKTDYLPVVAALIAEAVEEARKDIALEITGDAEDDWGGADFACGCPDPNPDNVPAALLETCRRTREAAARIARGEVSP